MRKSRYLTGAWSLGLVCLCLGLGLAEEGRSRREPTPAERLAVAKARDAASPRERVAAIKALAGLSNAQEARDLRVVETLLEIVRAKDDNLFVRLEALRTMAELQYSVFHSPTCVVPLVEVLRDGTEEELLRAGAARALARVLDPDDLQSRAALNPLLEIAEDRKAPLMVRLTAVTAAAELGDPASLASFCSILSQPSLDPFLKEHLLNSLFLLMPKLTGNLKVPLVTVNQELALVTDPNTPVPVAAAALRALAIQQKRGVKGIELRPVIARVLNREAQADLVVAAVEALGILADAAALADLLHAYDDFHDRTKPERAADVRIRTAIVTAMSDLLNAQIAKQAPNDETVKGIAEALIRIVDPQAGNLEVAAVVENAVFSLRYLYPKKLPFLTYQQPAIEKLLRRLMKPGAGDSKEALQETLIILSRRPIENLARWIKWYNETYPSAKLEQK